MKYNRMLGLLAMVTAAMVGLTASASATTLTGPGGSTTPQFHAEHEGTHVELHNAIVNIRCQSTILGKVTSHGSGVTVGGHFSDLDFFNCTDEWVVHTLAKGSFEVHYTEGNNGTLTSTGAKIQATRAGLSCIYEANATHLGRITGEVGAQGQGTLDLSGSIPRVGGSFLCGGSSALLTGSYITTQTLKVDA